MSRGFSKLRILVALVLVSLICLMFMPRYGGPLRSDPVTDHWAIEYNNTGAMVPQATTTIIPLPSRLPMGRRYKRNGSWPTKEACEAAIPQEYAAAADEHCVWIEYRDDGTHVIGSHDPALAGK